MEKIKVRKTNRYYLPWELWRPGARNSVLYLEGQAAVDTAIYMATVLEGGGNVGDRRRLFRDTGRAE